ncbi:MAG: VTT domain-containing protein [Sulfuritalea sp.]|nr:VTT domain-containing protein [Sulfuritalea sp.]
MRPEPLRLSPGGNWPAALLALLLAFGLGAHFLEWFEWREALAWARGHAGQWWLPLALVLLQTVLFMFALPGSTLLWVVAPLYAPFAATLILTAGGTGGALAAYWFARRLTQAQRERLRRHRAWRLLARESDFLALCALRLVPAFPHSVLNYGAGILRLPVGRFLAAAAIGFGFKAFLYSSVVHRILETAELRHLLRPEALLPLLLLALLLFLVRFLWRRRARASR